jgi:hypothetical protein
MQWEFDETQEAYTLDASPYRAVVQREPKGEWTARIDGPEGSRVRREFAFWDDAKLWAQGELAELRAT